jgi:hypothetical protein
VGEGVSVGVGVYVQVGSGVAVIVVEGVYVGLTGWKGVNDAVGITASIRGTGSPLGATDTNLAGAEQPVIPIFNTNINNDNIIKNRFIHPQLYAQHYAKR